MFSTTRGSAHVHFLHIDIVAAASFARPCARLLRPNCAVVDSDHVPNRWRVQDPLDRVHRGFLVLVVTTCREQTKQQSLHEVDAYCRMQTLSMIAPKFDVNCTFSVVASPPNQPKNVCKCRFSSELCSLEAVTTRRSRPRHGVRGSTSYAAPHSNSRIMQFLWPMSQAPRGSSSSEPWRSECALRQSSWPWHKQLPTDH